MKGLTGAYVPGGSPLHRLPAGVKLAGLAVCCTVLLLLRPPAALAAAAAVVAALYAVSGVGAAAAWAQVRPVRWFALALFGMQLVVADLSGAVSSTLRVVLAIALAGLVTLTTRTSDLMAFLERCLAPARFAGLDPFRLSLLLSLTLRSVPVVAELATRVREAQRARGVERSPRAFAVPLVVGALRHADALGEALAARGLDD
ncbi:energy-coupling factor transporter transmembrane protein EcfT [Microbispora triticiradicis]|uniref:Energy-coupling factor transporter transmembrane protein EcfT n=3 Tax=Microbispora TaxID=2005 RepID=A0ABY3LZG2_9ACTN|nr:MULTISPECIES: energy-coupling factor transporter transmembrane protein EcfT [Microbispora]RGA00659.1 energy-coupling factor transporter transmembrane protein EcfT [Microbispora triticiradicis]TLP55181.1 energy-coupling factor transporter transmembrane protein EcfT [Microbispora fusca]TYB59667.1 energy-coupling factor transporter transmembrane protein EcfT [Microbispora tritici]GLW22422.1 cobalt ABC transporter [Microbispora amethystogenes]